MGAARRQISTVITATPSGQPAGPQVAGAASGRATWQRDDLALEHYDEVTALIQGFEFFTDLPQAAGYPADYDAADGYTSRGITLSVDVVELSAETVTLEWHMRFGLGGTEDREKMNRAIPHARIGAQLDVLLVGTSASRLHRDAISYELSYPHQQPFQERILEPADEETQRLTMRGDPDHGAGIWGLHAVSMQLTPNVGCAEDQERCPAGDSCGTNQACNMTYGPAGYYIREMAVDVDMADYDEATGRAQFLIDGFASNASEAITFYAMNHKFSAGVTWLQTDGAPRRRSLNRTHSVGAHTIELRK
jgi:hypothetical protein